METEHMMFYNLFMKNQRTKNVYIHTFGEILYQIRYEQATKPEDILFRRTRLGFLDKDVIFNVYEKVFQIMAQKLKWPAKFKKEFLKENFEYIRNQSFD